MATALMAGHIELQADELRLTTAIPTGNVMQIALNADLQAEITWENGDKQTIVSDGSLQDIAVKSASFTISSITGNITSLYVQGNQLTSMDVSGATSLTSIYAADNQLSTLDVSKLKSLSSLDVQGNNLTELLLTANTGLKNLNIADNQLTSAKLKLSSTTRLENFVAANNQLTTSPVASVLREAKTIWAPNNQFTSVALNNNSSLHSLVMTNNKLSSLTLIKQPELTDLWVDNNTIKTLNLSNGTPSLRVIAADHNQLNSITWDVTDNKKSLKYAYLNDNVLFPGSLPTRSLLTDIVYAPQADYELEERYPLGKAIDLSSLLLKNGYETNITTNVKFVDREGKALVKGTDYTDTRRQYTFKTPHAGIRVEATCSVYPNTTFYSSRFTVGDVIDAVENIPTSMPLSITTGSGSISVTTNVASTIRIIDLKGITLANETIEGSHTWSVPAGIYVVNGQKVVVSR